MLGDEVEGVDNGADGQADALYRTTAPLRSDSDTITANRNNVSHLNLFDTFVPQDISWWFPYVVIIIRPKCKVPSLVHYIMKISKR